ncbi:MAG: hypothetical protein ACI9U5_000772 [Colwellia sp.]
MVIAGLILCSASSLSANTDKQPYTVKESTFSKTLTPGKFLLPAKEGWWNWGMASIYDEQGKLHIFNASILYKGKKGCGYWLTKCTIVHYVADSMEGPFIRKETVFSSDNLTYCNPQVSKVGDTYVMVFLTNPKPNSKMQAVGIATAKSLNGPWTESPNNPVIKPMVGSVNAVHASNPTFVKDRDGKYRIYYKSMTENPGFREISLSIANDINGPYVDQLGALGTISSIKYGEPVDLACLDSNQAAVVGTWLHQCYQVLISKPELLERLFLKLATINKQVALKEQLTVQVEGLKAWANKHWKAPSYQTELPMLSELDNSVTLSGILDLLIETIEGYWIVDHKTDRNTDDKQFKHHLPQLLAYAEHIKLSKPVIGVAINWVREGRLTTVKLKGNV